MQSSTSHRVFANPTGREASRAYSRQPGKPTPKTLQTVLLVEDDDALREVMEACLGMTGYVVIPCCDAQSAVLAFESSCVDLLLTDLQMPGRSASNWPATSPIARRPYPS